MTERRKSYLELLQDPRWQRKRLEILNRDQWTCTNCGATSKTLHEHHAYYEKGIVPWDYPDESLTTYCVECHQKAQDMLKLLHRQIGRIDSTDIYDLYGFALGLESRSYPMVVLDVLNYEVAAGLGKCWDLSAEEVIAELDEGKIDGYRLDELAKSKGRVRR
jgi:hypothetical protein